jgi:hypothetical protein
MTFKKPIVMTKNSECHAKSEEDIGVNTNKKDKPNSMCNSEVNTVIEPEVGVSCKMNEDIVKKNSECDANQFEQDVGINTLIKDKKNQETQLLNLSQVGVNTLINDKVNQETQLLNLSQVGVNTLINDKVNQESSTELINLSQNQNTMTDKNCDK